jgi:hypothetical protein
MASSAKRAARRGRRDDADGETPDLLTYGRVHGAERCCTRARLICHAVEAADVTWQRTGVQMAVLVATAVLISALGTGLLVLLGREVSDAAESAVAGGVVGALATVIGTLSRPRIEAAERARGAVFASIRASQGANQRVSERWSGAEVRPAPGRVTVMPTGGPSAVPFELEVLAADDTGQQARGRPVLAGAPRLVTLTTPSGVVELALSRGHVEWLLEAVEPGGKRHA